MDTTRDDPIYDEEGMLRGDFVHRVEAMLDAGQPELARELTRELREADLADLLTLLAPERRVPLVVALGDDFKPAVLSELDWTVRDQLVEALPNQELVKAVKELDTDDAVYVLESLEQEDQDEILAQIPEGDRAALERGLEYPEESAGRLMQADFIAVPPFWTVGRTIDYMRDTEDLPDDFSEIYVVDPSFHLVGTVPLDRLLRSKRPVRIEEIMESDVNKVLATEDQEEVARQFQRYDLYSAPVVDKNSRLVGVVTVDDMVEVIQEEAEEDIKLLGGVGDESLADSVLATTRSRFLWLVVNLCTAILASQVIKLFDASIEQMVALAVLMPIVASMGGNAGTQTMTVAVRALATRELGSVNAMRIILREVSVGLLNGLLFAVILGLVVLVWFGTGKLGLVIGAAMIFNHFAAALSGILIPLALDHFGFDPAVSSGVFVTTVTDIVGFFAFLGLATLVLL
ncbi:MAG: magnesium transporter [Hyphomicrobiaceae bacterium]|nr:magnesium transporter [Hyphomicrobiaceae bacterium]